MGLPGLRKHSKFSASGAERWLECAGSVGLSENLPDIDSVYSIEGTKGHSALERALRLLLSGAPLTALNTAPEFTKEMVGHAGRSAKFLYELHQKENGSELLIETRVHLDFIHPDMFGTTDSAVIDYFGTLHVYDYKYGKGHAVSPFENKQMIFYGLGLAHLYDFNFKRVRLWIDQPRIKGYDGPVFWEISVNRLKEFIKVFKQGVDRVINKPAVFKEGSWCFFCKAKKICPLKQQKRHEVALSVFSPVKP